MFIKFSNHNPNVVTYICHLIRKCEDRYSLLKYDGELQAILIQMLYLDLNILTGNCWVHLGHIFMKKYIYLGLFFPFGTNDFDSEVQSRNEKKEICFMFPK